MKSKWLLLGLLACLFAIPAAAQDSVPKVEISGDYSYFRFNPAINQLHSRSLNGGGGSVMYNYNDWFGVKGEFMGYGSTSWTTTFAVPVVTPHGTIPVGTYNSQGNMFTYQFGPQITIRTPRVNYFGEFLFGGSNTNGYANLVKSINAGGGNLTVTGVQHPFTMVLGGGLDINITKNIAFRPMEIDYVLTRYSNPITNVNNQNSFRYLAGIVFRFGGGPPPTPNRPPVASCSATPAMVYVGSGDTVMVRADASDPDNDTLTYTWTASGGAAEGTGSQVRWNSSGLANGVYSVSARVDDGRGGTANCSTEIRVEPRPNRPPTMTCAVVPNSVPPGGRVRITATASDPDNDPLTFTWRSNGGQIVGSGADIQLDTAGLGPGPYTVTGRVDDRRGGAADCQGQFSVQAPPPPSAVEIRLALRSIYFPTALPTPSKPDAGLIASQQVTLTSLANDFKEYLATKPDAHIVLGGHADHRGTPEFNKALSERRVEITKRFLVGQGIPEANIAVEAFGEEENLTADQVKELVQQHPNLSQEQKDKILKNLQTITLAQNRRVDITLSSTGQQSVRQFPFNAEDSLTLLNPKEGSAKPAAKKKRK